MENQTTSNGASASEIGPDLPQEVVSMLQEGRDNGFRFNRLDLYLKKIKDNMMLELCEWIDQLDGKVDTLNLGYNGITSKGASLLFNVLKNTKSSIKSLWMIYNQIDDDCIQHLGEYIQANKHIKSVYIGGSNITDKGIEILSSYIKNNTTLAIISVEKNLGVTRLSVPTMIKMIESSHLVDINITETAIPKRNVLVVPLAHNIIKYGMSEMDLSQRHVSDDDALEICNVIKMYGVNKLEEINFSSNEIGSKGASALFDTLRDYHSKVSNIVFRYNSLDHRCMGSLGEYIQKSLCVQKIDIVKNKLDDKAITELADYLTGNLTLNELNLSGNKDITNASVPTLLDLVSASSITKLSVESTSISQENQHEILRKCEIPIDQRKIPTNSNSKSAAKLD